MISCQSCDASQWMQWLPLHVSTVRGGSWLRICVQTKSENCVFVSCIVGRILLHVGAIQDPWNALLVTYIQRTFCHFNNGLHNFGSNKSCTKHSIVNQLIFTCFWLEQLNEVYINPISPSSNQSTSLCFSKKLKTFINLGFLWTFCCPSCVFSSLTHF